MISLEFLKSLDFEPIERFNADGSAAEAWTYKKQFTESCMGGTSCGTPHVPGWNADELAFKALV